MLIDLCIDCCGIVCYNVIPTYFQVHSGEQVEVNEIPFSFATQIMRGTVEIYRRDMEEKLDMVGMVTVNNARYCARHAPYKIVQ